jgi:hypothetical protein
MAITPLPPAPLPTDSTAQFNTKAFDWVASLEDFVTETNATATAVDVAKDDAETAASNAATSAANAATQVTLAANQVTLAAGQVALAADQADAAATSAETAAAATNAVLWVSGTTYAIGFLVYSPIDKRAYRRLTAGSGTTDPSADATNWSQLTRVVEQADIGTAPNEIPLNQYLGSLAYQDLENVTIDGGVATLDTATITSIQNDTAISNVEPSLMLNFAQVKKLDPRITYARASTATYYDGVTNSKAEENLLTYSQEFDNVVWLKSATTVTANSIVAPDGTTTADTVSAAGTNYNAVYRSFSAVLSAGVCTFSFYAKQGTKGIVRFDANSALTGSLDVRANFDLVNGVLGTVDTGTLTASMVDAGDGWYRCIVYWTRSGAASANGIIAMSDTTSSAFGSNSTSGDFYLWGAQLEQRSAVSSYTPTTTQPITLYQPTLLTAPSGVARFDHNPTTTESLGLLIEEQRTNLLTYSEQFDNAAWVKSNSTVTANQTVAPDGTLTAEKFVATTASAPHGMYITSTSMAANTYTASVFLKAKENQFGGLTLAVSNGRVGLNVDLLAGVITSTYSSGPTLVNSNVEPVGNGWFRVSVTASNLITATMYTLPFLSDSATPTWVPADVVPTYTGDGYSGIFIWGAQLEVGGFSTSYIPTVASQVTRSADSAVITGSNFSSWYSQGQGSLYTESIVRSVSPTNNYAVVALLQTNGSANNRMSMWQGGGLSGFPLGYRLFVYANSATQVVIDATSGMTANVPEKMAAIIENNDWVLVKGGNILGTSTVGTMNVPDRMYIGSSGIGTTSIYPLNGTIKKLSYFPARLSNEELQEMTS